MSANQTMGWWRVRRLRSARRHDLVMLAVLVSLAATAIVAGRHGALAMTPRSSAELGKFVESLDVPSRLPDLPLVDGQGGAGSLYARVHQPRAIVAFYASWCGPCQAELPKLVKQLGESADILIVVSPDDRDEARQKLTNMELLDRGFLVDTGDALHRAARVTALPTTFLINRQGVVLEHIVGFSEMAIWRLKSKLGKEL